MTPTKHPAASVFAAAALALCSALGGCAAPAQPQAAAEVLAAEPLSLEYQTGRLFPSKEKHVTTDAERQGAQEVKINAMRSTVIDPLGGK